MFCPECGSKTSPNDNFCSNCGTPLTEAARQQRNSATASAGAAAGMQERRPGMGVLVDTSDSLERARHLLAPGEQLRLALELKGYWPSGGGHFQGLFAATDKRLIVPNSHRSFESIAFSRIKAVSLRHREQPRGLFGGEKDNQLIIDLEGDDTATGIWLNLRHEFAIKAEALLISGMR